MGRWVTWGWNGVIFAGGWFGDGCKEGLQGCFFSEY